MKKPFEAKDLEDLSEADMARALVLGLATMLAKSNTERASLKTAAVSKEGFIAIVNAVQKCIGGGNHLQDELNVLRWRGPERYIKYATSDIRKEIRGRRPMGG